MMMKGKKNYNIEPFVFHWLTSFFVSLLMMIGLFFQSCEDDLPPEPDPVDPVTYLEFNLSTENQLQIETKAPYEYELTTSGEDPYVSLVPLSLANSSEKVVFTFEYICIQGISDFQIFFGSPISEERSIKVGPISGINFWKTFSIDLGESIDAFAWGDVGDFLRLDFGNKSGAVIQIRNMHLRIRTDEDLALIYADQDLSSLDFNISKYLSTNFGSQITEVKADLSTITIIGNYPEDGSYSLCEVKPYDHVTQINKFQNVFPLNNSSFSIDVDRFVLRDGFKYDRVLSKWAIVKIGTQADELVSHARYADEIYATQNLPAQQPSGRKGLGGYYVTRGFETDLDDLGISSATVNVAFTGFMFLEPIANTISHTYGGKTYYFYKPRLELLDQTLQVAQSKNIVVAAILLVEKAEYCADPEIGKLLQHPDCTSEGYYTMPNMTTPESVNCYAAALDFLANRYCRSDKSYGRIHHWIMHNEVDAGIIWTNMGDKPMSVYMDTYIKSMRMCYNIVRNYDANSEVFASFTHSWSKAIAPDYYITKEMLKTLQDFCNAEGDFQWALAYHPYPEDICEPKTWNDQNATFSMNTSLITFKNMEVLDAWIKMPANKYKGSIKRTIWLSENGTNSPTYSDTDLKEQAAGFAYAWKKFKELDGIDAMQWHNWIDNRSEFDLRIGLRRFTDDSTDPGGRKPVWFAYQAAGTNEEDNIFDQYKSIIGITNWSEIMHDVR